MVRRPSSAARWSASTPAGSPRVWLAIPCGGVLFQPGPRPAVIRPYEDDPGLFERALNRFGDTCSHRLSAFEAFHRVRRHSGLAGEPIPAPPKSRTRDPTLNRQHWSHDIPRAFAVLIMFPNRYARQGSQEPAHASGAPASRGMGQTAETRRWRECRKIATGNESGLARQGAGSFSYSRHTNPRSANDSQCWVRPAGAMVVPSPSSKAHVG